ncbi:hypothetical protein B1222_00740 [Paenibacillus larvae subsp. pulvifaciens]|nr:hypothetical protein B1222_00740 [Paenibacillus larvae subsp. pulvifaciens]AQZ48445.1 hypothetical protein B5S25_19495 [Paenibacillus larvae subsp. pulvifaciens]
MHLWIKIRIRCFKSKVIQADVGNSEEVEATVKAIQKSMGTDERGMCGFPGGIQIRNIFSSI